jgi:hypothetical protein
VAVRDPHIIPFREDSTPRGVRTHEWFEIRLDEFKVQKRLPCYRDTKGEFWVESQAWYEWSHDLVEYFIHNGYKGPEIDAFIKDHALGGSGKVGRS